MTANRKFAAGHKLKKTTHRRTRRFFLRSRKRLVRFSILTANLALLSVAIFFVISSHSSRSTAQNATLTPVLEEIVGPQDQVSSADIAVHIARIARLPEAVSVVNHADSVSALDATAPADTAMVAKPQVVSAALPSKKDIQTYTVVAGDTVAAIATKFGVSSDSIKWSNSLTGDTVAAGKVLKLPPAGTNGIVYTVSAGDTPDKLAQKYGTDKDLLISFNDAEVSGIKTGEQILIPNGVIVAAPVVTASYSSYSGFAWGGDSPLYTANGYDYGWCTWWAANRRSQLGRPIPSNLGNANSWIALARRAGLPTGSTPQDGAVFSQSGTGYLGHVGVVEKVNEDGSFQASDMNYPIWGRATYRTVSASEVGNYKFIY